MIWIGNKGNVTLKLLTQVKFRRFKVLLFPTLSNAMSRRRAVIVEKKVKFVLRQSE